LTIQIGHIKERKREREREKKTKKGGTDNIKDRSHSQR
jgi:hypothetical protein